MKLSSLLSKIGISLPPELQTATVGAITQNSKTAGSGTLFVCLCGAHTDGHAFAPAAYANGCRWFVAEHTLDLPADALVWIVKDTRRALGILAAAFYGNPSRKMAVIGITGTKGKTSTAILLADILNQNGIPCGYIGTNGVQYGQIRIETENTTPDALTLQKTLAEMLAAGCEAAVLEVSSQSLLQDRVAGMIFDTCLFTNFSRDHIGPLEHPDLENYFACKHRLFTEFGARTVVANLDDEATASMLAGTTAEKIIGCSQKGPAEYRAIGSVPYRTEIEFGQTVTLLHSGKAYSFRLPLIGDGNVSNALLAVATAVERFGVSIQDAVKSLEHATIPGRSEWISLPNGAVAVIDYAHNEVSLRQLLLSLRPLCGGRLICLFGSVGERTKERRFSLGSVAAEFADACVLTSDNPGTEPPEQILDEIATAFAKSRTPYVKISDRAEAIRYAVKHSHAGDILVLAGKGHETYQLIGKKKVPFSEREILQTLSAADPIR